MARLENVWSGASRTGLGCWRWCGSSERAVSALRAAVRLGQRWLLFDPGEHVARRLAGDSSKDHRTTTGGGVWRLTVEPGRLADAICAGSRAFDGAALVQLSTVNGLWGGRGPRWRLWMPLTPLLDSGFPVLDCRIAAQPVDKARGLHHRCGDMAGRTVGTVFSPDGEQPPALPEDPVVVERR